MLHGELHWGEVRIPEPRDRFCSKKKKGRLERPKQPLVHGEPSKQDTAGGWKPRCFMVRKEPAPSPGEEAPVPLLGHHATASCYSLRDHHVPLAFRAHLESPSVPDFSDGQKSLLQKLLISTPFGPGNIQFHKIRKCWAWNAHRVGIAPRPGRSGLRREPPKMGFTVKMFLSPQLPARNITSTGLCSGDSPESFGLWFASLGSRRLQTRRPISKR